MTQELRGIPLPDVTVEQHTERLAAAFGGRAEPAPRRAVVEGFVVQSRGAKPSTYVAGGMDVECAVVSPTGQTTIGEATVARDEGVWAVYGRINQPSYWLSDNVRIVVDALEEGLRDDVLTALAKVACEVVEEKTPASPRTDAELLALLPTGLTEHEFSRMALLCHDQSGMSLARQRALRDELGLP